MTRDECIRQAVWHVGSVKIKREQIFQFADEALAPIDKRDSTMVDGKGFKDTIDEDGNHKTVEIQIHPPRKVAPYNYGPQDVLWLEREIRRRAGL